MSRNYSRRSALALLGGAVLAGCSGSGRDRYWDDPPAFDATGLGNVTDGPVPERPEPLPVPFPDARRSAFADRVDALLAPIPEPLTAETLPNGKLREAITTGRRDAREALDRMRSEAGTLPAVTAAADAREHAATAAGVWATISTVQSLDDVTEPRAEVGSAVRALSDELPDVADGPIEGAVLYGELEEWLDVARRDTLVGRKPLGEQVNPLRVGRLAGDIERVRAELELAAFLRDRYVDGLAQPRPIAGDLTAAVDALAPKLERRFRRLHDGEPERLMVAPSADELLTRDVPRDAPGARLLSGKVYELFRESRYGPVALPWVDVTHPALTVRETFRAVSLLDAVDAVRERVDGGDDLFPPDARTIREAREGAIDAVDGLVRATSPIERWMGWRLVPTFDGPDEVLTAVTGPDDREIASAYGEYVWIEAVARGVPNATRTVEAALPR